MKNILVQLSDGVYAKLLLYFPPPVTFGQQYDEASNTFYDVVTLVATGATTVLKSMEETEKYFDGLCDEAITSTPTIHKITFLQENYQPVALDLWGSDFQKIQDAVLSAPPRMYETWKELYDHCQPDY